MITLKDILSAFDLTAAPAICAFAIASSLILTMNNAATKQYLIINALSCLMSLVFLSIILSTTSLLLILVCGTGLTVFGFLSVPFYEKSVLSAELALKYAMMALIWFLLLSAGIIFCYAETHSVDLRALDLSRSLSQISFSCVFLAFALWQGVVPFYALTLDCADHSSALGTLSFLSRLFASTFILHRVLSQTNLDSGPAFFNTILVALLIASMVVPVLRGGDQVTVRRSCLYLVLPLTPMFLTLVVTGHSNINLDLQLALTVGIIAIALPASLGFLAFWRGDQSSQTWEEFAGSGRKYPVLGFCFLYLMGTLAGFPGTLGALVRIELMRLAYISNNNLVTVAFAVSTIVGLTTVLKFGIFLYAKPASYQLLRRHQTKNPAAPIIAVMLLALANIYYYNEIFLGTASH